PRGGGGQTDFFIVTGDARDDGWTELRCAATDHPIGLRKIMPGLAALSDRESSFAHLALADRQHASLEHQPRAQRAPIVAFGAPSRLSDAFDVEPKLHHYHRADIEHLGGLGQRPRPGPWAKALPER